MKLTKSTLKQLIREELDNVLEQDVGAQQRVITSENWDSMRDTYFRCRNKANGGNSPKLTMRRVVNHIKKARTMKDGFNVLTRYIKNKYPSYPGC